MNHGISRIALIGLVIFAQPVYSDEPVPAQKVVRTVNPDKFTELPRSISLRLKELNCQIPSWSRLENVISGQFGGTPETDWAVLCANTETAAVLVFFDNKPDVVGELARSENQGHFLPIYEPEPGFIYTQQISLAPKENLIQVFAEQPEKGWPTIKHDGISLVSEAARQSSYLYFDGRKWHHSKPRWC